MPKDVYGSELSPGDPVMVTAYNRIHVGVIVKFTDACVRVDAVSSEMERHTIWNLQPYRRDTGDHATASGRNETIIKIGEEEYHHQCMNAGEDPRQRILDKNPSFFKQKLVSL